MFLNAVLIIVAAILKPHKKILIMIKLINRLLAIVIAGFLSQKVFPMVPEVIPEILNGLVPWPMLTVTVSYIILMYAASLMFWQAADNCTIQLKNRFNVDP